MKFNYQMRFAKTGRARFIAHLDTLSILVRAIRRAGFGLAFTEGMRPKPILNLAMPLGVGVEGEDEICEFSLSERAPLTELAKKISRELPEGMELKSLGPTYERSKAAARVGSVSYRIELADGFDAGALEDALAHYNSLETLTILRKRPKGDKEVDIKRYIPELMPAGEQAGVRFEMEVTPEGTGRPDEVIQALAEITGKELHVRRIVRTGIHISEEAPPAPPRRGGMAPRRRRR